MNDLQQVERIKIKLRLAKSTDPFFETFGSASHQYHLNPPLELKVIEAFEQDYKIQLPLCYKTFLSEVGNGGMEHRHSVAGNAGAGPCYGIYELGHFRQFITDPSLQYLENDVFFNSEVRSSDWSQLYASMDEAISDDDYDKWVARVYSGILIIGYCGCSNFYGIILHGTDAGRVLYTYDEMQYCPHFVAQPTFLDFYENWLDPIINPPKGKPILKTEKECFDRFLSDRDREPYWKKVSLTYLRQLELVSAPTLTKLWEQWTLESDPIVRMYFLCIFVRFDYEQSKTELNRLSLHQPMDFLRLLHLYASQRTQEWHQRIQEIQQRMTSHSEIMEYIQYVTLQDLGLGVNGVENPI